MYHQNNISLNQLRNDLQMPNRQLYINNAVNQFYNLGYTNDEILPQNLIFITLIAVDYLINSNDFPEINENTLVNQLYPNLGNNNNDPYGLNQIEVNDYLRTNFNRIIVNQHNNTSVIAMQADVFDYLDQFNFTCLHLPNHSSIFYDWLDFVNSHDLPNNINPLENININDDIKDLPKNRLININPRINQLNYIYLFPNDYLTENIEDTITNSINACLNAININQPNVRNIVFNGFLNANLMHQINVHYVIDSIRAFIQNNDTNFDTIYIISKNEAILNYN